MGQYSGYIFGTLAVIVVGSAIVAKEIYFKPIARDEVSLCPENIPLGSQIGGHTVLLIDKSDKWTGSQSDRLRGLILSIRDELAVNERLSIFQFADKVEVGFQPVFSLCNPGRAADANIFTSNPRRWEQRFQERFGGPLDEVLELLAAPNSGDHSPILEVFSDILNREELSRLLGRKRLVVVSDMLQNSSVYSFFAPSSHQSVEELPWVPVLKAKNPFVVSDEKSREISEAVGGLMELREYDVTIYQLKGRYREDQLQNDRW